MPFKRPAKKSTKLTLTGMPNEILVQVLELLDLASLLAVCSTNRFFFNFPDRWFFQNVVLPFERTFKIGQEFPMFEEYMPLTIVDQDTKFRADPLYTVYTRLKRRYFFLSPRFGLVPLTRVLHPEFLQIQAGGARLSSLVWRKKRFW